VFKFSHVIWSVLVLSCHSYSCLVHLASHNVKEPWTRRFLWHVSTENRKQRLLDHLPQAQQLYSKETVSARIHHKSCSAYDNKRKTLHTNSCVQILLLEWDVWKEYLPPSKNKNTILRLKIKTVDYNKPNYLGHPTSCLDSHLQQLYSIS